jgi:hypothetical protein
MSGLQRLYEIAHRWRGDLLAVDPDNRALLVDFVRSGIDEEGGLIEHSDYQHDILHCLDCPRFNTKDCLNCKELQAARSDTA